MLSETEKTFIETVLRWERKFRDLHQVLLVSSLVQTFLPMVIEGDEASTQVKKTVPPEESLGWPIALQVRASRFLWELDCEKREQALFQQAIAPLCQVIEQTTDVSRGTDGERRYGNLLFDICCEVVRTGTSGRANIYAQSEGGLGESSRCIG